MSPQISVIVPVYNGEEFLEKCLNSILSQTLENIEVICINDGSTDGTLKILEEYAERDNRIRIVSQKNKGLGASRNVGLELSEGEYVAFVDADDYLVLSAFEKVYDASVKNGSDLTIFETINFKPDEKFIIDSFEELYLPLFFNKVFGEKFDIDFEKSHGFDFNSFNFTIFEGLGLLGRGPVGACRKLYKRRFLKENKELRFPTGLLFEDIPFHVKSLIKANKLSWLPYGLYFYVQYDSENRISSNIKNSRKIFDIFEILMMVKKFFIDESLYDDLKQELLFLYVKTLDFLMHSVNEKYQEEFFNRMKSILTPFFKEVDETCSFELFNNVIYNNFYISVMKSNSMQEFNYTYDILTLENTIKTLNDRINLLEIVVSQKDEGFAKANKVVSQRGEIINELNKNLSKNAKKIQILYEKNMKLKEEQEQNKLKINAQKNKINEMRSSMSWRVTNPLRKTTKFLKSLF